MLIMFYVDYVLKYHREIPQILSNLTHQPKAFYFSTVLDPGSHNINSGCVNIAVSQNICQFSNIFFDIIKCSREQFAQIVRKNLAWIYASPFAKSFHLCPYRSSIERFSSNDSTFCSHPIAASSSRWGFEQRIQKLFDTRSSWNDKRPDGIMNCTLFVRQYGILFRKWGVFVCQRDNESTTERRR